MNGPTATGSQQLLVLYPQQIDDTRQLIEAIKGDQAVVLHTSQVSDGQAQRLIDFACGGMEALAAKVHRIDAETFLFAPGHAWVGAAAQAA